MGCILNDITLGVAVEWLLWWIRIFVYGLVAVVLILGLYKDVQYWIEEYKKDKNKFVQRKEPSEGIVTISEGQPERVNAVLYFFYVLFVVGIFFVVILTLSEKFGLI